MKRKVKLISILFATLLLLMISPAHARVYQATATHSVCYPTLTLAVAIDTDADIWTATWHGEPYLITPMPSIFYAFTIKFIDDKGFSEEYSFWKGDDVKNKGTITIEGYTNTGCWTHTWCQWEYFNPVILAFVRPELWIDLYVGQIPAWGGGGWWWRLRGESITIEENL